MEKFSEEFWRFVKEHQADDVHRLRLKYAGRHDEQVDWAIDQIEARKKVDRKLPLFFQNETLLFPSVLSAEQCSSEDTAIYKQHLVSGRFDTICDLTGGLGIDSYYLAAVASRLTYIERFPHYCDVARHNFEVLRQKNIEVRNIDCRDYLSQPHTPHALYYIDPARRGAGNKRLYNLADCEPSVAEILPIVFAEHAALLLKASPMLDITQTIRDFSHISQIHVVAVRNECKEVLFLFEPYYQGIPQIYCAHETTERDWQTFTFSLEEEALLPSSPDAELKTYLYEPNSAIMKAGAFKSVAVKYGLDKLAVNTHLYTADRYLADFPGRIFEIIEVVPFSKQILKRLASRYPQANVSTRNFPLAAEEVRRLGAIKDGGDIYLFATTINGRKTMIYCKKKMPF